MADVKFEWIQMASPSEGTPASWELWDGVLSVQDIKLRRNEWFLAGGVVPTYTRTTDERESWTGEIEEWLDGQIIRTWEGQFPTADEAKAWVELKVKDIVREADEKPGWKFTIMARSEVGPVEIEMTVRHPSLPEAAAVVDNLLSGDIEIAGWVEEGVKA